jgi:Ca2+/Na+ antiporter
MKQFLSHWFWPNPGGWHYNDLKVQLVLGACVALIALSFAIGMWRSRQKNPVTRSLSASWSGTVLTFGIVALVMAVSRVETIQFFSMRALWLLWALCFGLYIVAQLLAYRNRHYVVLDRKRTEDERDKYLPRKKR